MGRLPFRAIKELKSFLRERKYGDGSREVSRGKKEEVIEVRSFNIRNMNQRGIERPLHCKFYPETRFLKLSGSISHLQRSNFKITGNRRPKIVI